MRMSEFYKQVLDPTCKAEGKSLSVRAKGRDRCNGAANPVSRPKLKHSTAVNASERACKPSRKGKQHKSKAQASHELTMALRAL